ncbi:MAG: DNA mismatch repair endonuclease MutL [Calditrichia bacterium]|nr:DNA mismatch repair endonuclease MutL [Calditrichia bacterium]
MEVSSITQNKIHILPVSLSNKIAAGEVVERPASVVKELIENSIDSDATKISVVLKNSGKELVQVVDNGLGMTGEDLKLAFKRHATSKIWKVEDLEQIETLGFRGEALPSIASVAKVEAISREKGQSVADRILLDAGRITKSDKIAAPVGTNIQVKQLFYNTPARRNFLRADSTELHQIISIIKRFFLAYPDVEFVVIHDDSELFHLKSGTIKERIIDVFGEDQVSALVKVNDQLGGIELSGFISKPDKVRRARGNQFLFLNGRPIQHKSFNHAIMQAYGNLIQSGEYPLYCIFIELDPRLVDVNVHPSKMEVRFSNEKSLYHFFLSTIRKTFHDEKIIPSMESGTSNVFLSKFAEEDKKESILSELKNRSKYMGRGGEQQLSLVYFESGEEEDRQKDKQPEPSNAPTDVTEVHFWQIHNRYILSQIKSGIVIIDQHVAHERILFERILRILREGEQSVGQQLLFPQTITLSMDDFLKFKEIVHLLNKIGFVLRIFSGTSIVIDAIPVDVKVGREAPILLDIIDYYKGNPDREFDPLQKIAAAFSCKNAIKAGEQLSQAQMHAMIDQLFACESPYFCPHGRPVIITMDLEEFDRKFKRIT